MVDVDLSGVVAASSRRRRRSAEERRRMVEETLVVGSSVARVARKHGVNANQVFQGRRLYKGDRLGGQPGIGLKLLPVRVAEEVEQVEAPVPGAAAGWIHIELPRGVRISLAGAVDPVLIGAVLKGLCP